MITSENNDTQILRQQVQDYERLLNVLQAIGSSLDVEAILRQIMEEAMNLCNTQQARLRSSTRLAGTQ